MALATTDLIRSEGNLPESILDGVLQPHLTKATLEMKKLLGSAKYAAIKAYENSTVEEEINAFTACSVAEANIALSYAVYALNMETEGSGIVRTRGWDQSRSDLLSQNELESLSQHFKDTAMSLIEDYLPKPTDDPATEDKDESKTSVSFKGFSLSAI